MKGMKRKDCGACPRRASGRRAKLAFWKGLHALRKGRPFLVPGAFGPGRLPVRRLEDGSEGILLERAGPGPRPGLS
jgi:hypothetical protein